MRKFKDVYREVVMGCGDGDDNDFGDGDTLPPPDKKPK